MSHFAHIDQNGIVDKVIVAEQDFIDSGVVGNSKEWIQTSYNTKEGVHSLGGTPMRKNYAGIGFQYDKNKDAFIPPKPYDSWIPDDTKGSWKAPIDVPDKKKIYDWDEKSLSWVEDPKSIKNK